MCNYFDYSQRKTPPTTSGHCKEVKVRLCTLSTDLTSNDIYWKLAAAAAAAVVVVVVAVAVAVAVAAAAAVVLVVVVVGGGVVVVLVLWN